MLIDMILLELFSGNGDVSKAFERTGAKTFRVDWSESVEAELHADVSTLTVEQIIELCGGVPDVVWASPQCTTYSIATHRHRTMIEDLRPKTKMAENDDMVNVKMWELIDELLAHGTKYYFVENPQGRMRHMHFVDGRPRHEITYCSYGQRGTANGYEHLFIRKATDIWTNHPNPQFKNKCVPSNCKHEHGAWALAHKRDYLSRGTMPVELVDHIASIASE